MTTAFEEKRQARIERLHQAAETKTAEAESLFNAARTMQLAIPFGQPILVGHHSERRDRAYRGRIDSKMSAAVQASRAAEEYERRAKAAESNQAIFSDDPNAAEKLADKIARLEKRQDLMKRANALVRKSDRAGLAELGFSESAITELFTPDCFGCVGFADYALKNNGANIRRLKERLQDLEENAHDETTEREVNGIRIVDNVESNRLQIFFPGKPDPETIAKLKAHGFRWTPSLACWQAYRGNSATYWAGQIVG